MMTPLCHEIQHTVRLQEELHDFTGVVDENFLADGNANEGDTFHRLGAQNTRLVLDGLDEDVLEQRDERAVVLYKEVSGGIFKKTKKNFFVVVFEFLFKKKEYSIPAMVAIVSRVCSMA